MWCRQRPADLVQGLGHVGGFGNSDDGNLKIGLAKLSQENLEENAASVGWPISGRHGRDTATGASFHAKDADDLTARVDVLLRLPNGVLGKLQEAGPILRCVVLFLGVFARRPAHPRQFVT